MSSKSQTLASRRELNFCPTLYFQKELIDSLQFHMKILFPAVHCPLVPARKGLIINTKETKMNTEVEFSCSNGNALLGASYVVCLPSGNWSAAIPTCESKYLPCILLSREIICSLFKAIKTHHHGVINSLVARRKKKVRNFKLFSK